MAFFKASNETALDNTNERVISADTSKKEKLRYVRASNGKWYWLTPEHPLPTDYDEDIDY